MIPFPLAICDANGFEGRCGIPVWKVSVLAIIIILAITFGDNTHNDNKNKITEERCSDTSDGYKRVCQYNHSHKES